MLRLAALVAFTALLAACGGTVDDSAPNKPARQLDPLAVESPTPPTAVEAADGRSAFAVADGTVRRYSTVTGKVVRTYPLKGAWELTGISATGAWLALQRGDTEVLVLDARTGKVAKRVRLDGDFRVEAVSAEGDFLFLQQDFVDGSYAVRGYDLAAGTLLPGSLGTKGALVKMQGLASQVVASPDGRWLLTLYVNTQTNTSFVHALNLIERIALCINMPPCKNCNRDALGNWALALAPDNRTLFAANPAAGNVATVYLPTSQVIAQSVFRASPGGEPSARVAKDGSVVFTNGRTTWSFDPNSGLTERVAGRA
jgi:hypothetical protein